MNIEDYISSGLIEQYVMGLCSKEEEYELEQLKLQRPEVQKSITDFEILFEQNMMQSNASIDADIDSKILINLKSLNPIATPVISLNNTTENVIAPKKESKLMWLKPFAAVAMLLLTLSAIFNIKFYKKNKEQEALIAKANEIRSLPINDFKIMQNPEITPIAMNGVGYHAICKCTMFWDKKTGKAYIMVHHLMPTDDKEDYQLWAMVNNKPVSIGMINEKTKDKFIELPNIPEDATEFNVTLEKGGGSEKPNLEMLFLNGKV